MSVYYEASLDLTVSSILFSIAYHISIKLIKTILSQHQQGKIVEYEMFRDYIYSEENQIFDEYNRNKVYQDMTHPISSYFIASSHNTYLEGDQLRSNSSAARYVIM